MGDIKRQVDGVVSKELAPSGGWLGEYCKNSALFKDRICKTDGKEYKDGQLCPCFLPTSKLSKETKDE